MTNYKFDQIIDVIDALTGPEGCAWDQKQTPLTLCDYLVEECFELVEAIQSQDLAEISQEMGDVLFIILFMARYLEKKHPEFLAQVMHNNVRKMVGRHPHVFQKNNDQPAPSPDQWETIKKQEKAGNQENSGVFASLPTSLPPLIKAYRLNAKAARTGFTWPTDLDQEKKLQEEWSELQAALDHGDHNHQEEEFGDYLFSLVEYGRRQGLKANAALARANAKFLQRFQAMETMIQDQGLDLSQMTLAEMDQFWVKIK